MKFSQNLIKVPMIALECNLLPLKSSKLCSVLS